MKTKYFFILAATAMTFAACSNDDVDNSGSVEAQVSAGFDNSVTTRAVNTNNTWTAGDAIGVMVTEVSGTTEGVTSQMVDRYQNVKYTASSSAANSAFTSTAGIFFQDASETVTFAAYYPYQTSTAANALPGTAADGVVTVDTEDNNTEANQANIDFLFASGATATKSDPEVSFTKVSDTEDYQFKHKMAQLKLTIKASTSDGFTDAEAQAITTTTTAGTYTLGGLIHEGTFKVTTGATATTGTAVSDWDITSLYHGTDANAYTRTYSLILLPQDKSESALKFSAVIDDQTYTNNSSIAPNLEAGKTYQYTITLKKTGIKISGCTIANWDTGTGDSGYATM